MYDLSQIIKDLAVIFGIGAIVAFLFKLLHQPIIVGYLVAGVIIGPYTPPYFLISDLDNIKVIAHLGVIFLMFSIGLTFSFQKLMQTGHKSIVIGLIEVGVTFLLGYSVGKWMALSDIDCIYLASAISISSTIIIMKFLFELQLTGREFAQIVFGILIIEDILAILLLFILKSISSAQFISISLILLHILKIGVIVGAWAFAGRYLVPRVVKYIVHRSNQETLTVFLVAFCLLFVCVADHFDYSSALGAFISGSLLAETPKINKIIKIFKPIRDTFAAVFFIAMGTLIDPLVIWHKLAFILLIVFVTIFGKMVASSVAAALFVKKGLKSSLSIGWSMAQIGEMSIVIISMGVGLKVIDASLYPIIVSVVALTAFIVPYCITLSQTFGLFFTAKTKTMRKYH